MKRRPFWTAFTANDGHSIGLDSEGRGYELRNGELAPLPDPPPALPAVSKPARPRSKPRRRR